MPEQRVVTCVYCGRVYPRGTPTSGPSNSVLTAHIKLCDMHPLRKAEATIKKLRLALVGLIDVDGEEELKKLQIFMRMQLIPNQDKVVTINAIHALIDTLEYSHE